MSTHIIAESNPETKHDRVLIATRLAYKAKEVAKMVVGYQLGKSDAAREFAEGWGHNNAAATEHKLRSLEVNISAAAKDLVADADLFEALGLISREVEREIYQIYWCHINPFGDCDWAALHSSEVNESMYPVRRSKPYPLMNRTAIRCLWIMPEAVYNRVYTMLVSPEEQAADTDAYNAKMQAYKDQEDCIYKRMWEVRALGEDKIIALADSYRAEHPESKIPKPRYYSDGRYITGNSKEKLVQAILKVEFPTRLEKPLGYEGWLKNQDKE